MTRKSPARGRAFTKFLNESVLRSYRIVKCSNFLYFVAFFDV